MKQAQAQTAVITGAGSGLGLALALEFAKRGFNLALIDRNAQSLESLAGILDKEVQLLSIHAVDISLEGAVEAVAREIFERHGRVDILVNNAGVSVSKSFADTRQEDWEWLFATNFWGAVYCCRHFRDFLLKSKQGRIVNVISGFALMGFPGKSAYAASKGALMSLSQVLRTELQAAEVKVCLVIPPPLDTDIVRSGRHIDPDKQQAEAHFLAKQGTPLERAAAKIVDGILKGRFRILVGVRERGVDFLLRLMPTLCHNLLPGMAARMNFTGVSKGSG